MLFSLIRTATTVVLATLAVSEAHLVLTYPGWRGDNLAMNGTTAETDGLVEKVLSNGSTVYPYGMQWIYPCGGSPTSSNRTKWPVHGGGVAFQPGWFKGHAQGVIYVNMGFGTSPPNMSNPMIPATGIIGPTDLAYPNQNVCFPQVPLPVNYTATIGQNATIQVILLAQHGAALYSCVDITFADPSEVELLNSSNCVNSSSIQFTQIYATTSLTSAAVPATDLRAYVAWLPMAAALVGALLW